MNPDLVIIGSLDQLTVLPPFSAPVIGIPGGFAIFASAGARIWSNPVKIVSWVGENYSQEWLEEIQRSGIQTSGIRVLPGYHDHRSFEGYSEHFEKWTDKPISHFLERGFPFPKELFNYRSPSELAVSRAQQQTLCPKPDLVPADHQYPDAALIGPIGYRSQFQWVNFFRSRGIQILAMEFDSSYADPEKLNEIRQLIEGLDILYIHEQDLAAIFRGQSLTRWAMMARMAEWGVKIIITLRPMNQQLLYVPLHDEKWILPSYRSEIVDPTGHAAVFCGAFLARYTQTHDALVGAISGNVAASISMETTGYKPIIDCLPQLIDMRIAAQRERVYKV